MIDVIALSFLLTVLLVVTDLRLYFALNSLKQTKDH